MQMRTWGIGAGTFVCALGIAGALPVEAQDLSDNAPAARGEMVDRFYRGRAVINEAVQAAGGAQALRAMNALSFEVAGDVSNDVQGYEAARIGNPARDGSQRVINRFDFAGQRFYQRVEQDFESGYDSAFSTIWRGGAQYAVRYVPRDYAETASAPSPFGASGAVMVASRWLPPVILQRAFAGQRQSADVLDTAYVGPRSPFELQAGSVINAALVTGLNSDLPGRVIAQVTTPVYDSLSGDHLLIPQGARLIGTYDSANAHGDRRLLLVWNRLVMPNGWSLSLAGMEAADPRVRRACAIMSTIIWARLRARSACRRF